MTGAVYVTVRASLDDRAEKWLVGDLGHRHMTENVETVVAVPGDADYASSISFEYEHREGSVARSVSLPRRIVTRVIHRWSLRAGPMK